MKRILASVKRAGARAFGVASIAVAIATFGVESQAQEGWYFGPSATAYFLDSERFIGGDEDAVTGALNLGKRFSNNWAIEFGAGTEIGGNDIDTLKLEALYWLNDQVGSWQPYIVGGVTHYELDDSLPLNPDMEHTQQLALGVGLSKMLSRHWEFRSDIRALHKIREGSDGVDDAALNFALNYYFNPPQPVPVVEPEPVVRPAPAPAPKPEPKPEMRTITVRLNVLFEFDKAVVRAIYGDELQAVANAMKAHDDIELVLEGHTDAIGSDSYNQGLSERRVKAVEAKLAQDYGIDPDRISTVGYGESRPIATNDTREGRALNRRVIGELSYTEVVVD